MKKVIRYFIDAIMLVAMIVLMVYQVTGNMWHEVIGTVLFGLFIIHCILNRKWFTHLGKIAKVSVTSPERLIWFISDVLVLVDMLVLLVSSIFISKNVFAFLGLSGGGFLRYLHTMSSYAGLILMSIHLGCHWKIVMSQISSGLHLKPNVIRTWMVRVLALALVVLGVIASFRQNIGSKFIYRSGGKMGGSFGNFKPGEHSENGKQNGRGRGHQNFDSGSKEDGEDSDNKANAMSTFSEDIQDGESLDDFLSRLTCTGCGKQCSLLSPQCGVGSSQATQATTYFNSNSENSSNNQSEESSNSNSNNQSENNASTDSQNQNGVQPPDGDDAPAIRIESEDDGLISIFRDYIPITGMYVAGTYYALELIHRTKKKKKEEATEEE